MKATSLAALALVLLAGACASSSQPPAPGAPVDVTREANAASAASNVFFEFQVESPVRAAEGSCAPAYPDSLRAAGTTGEVVGQFIVDTKGMPEVESFKVIRSSHEAFTAAVRTALPCMRFTPARIRGGAVRQLVQRPFRFGPAR